MHDAPTARTAMVQTQMQYSPAQILAAARRAETDGRREYALQFFHHLTEQFPESQEAAAAREAIARLSPRPQLDSSEQPSGSPQPPQTNPNQQHGQQAGLLPHNQGHASPPQGYHVPDPPTGPGHGMPAGAGYAIAPAPTRNLNPNLRPHQGGTSLGHPDALSAQRGTRTQ